MNLKCDGAQQFIDDAVKKGNKQTVDYSTNVVNSLKGELLNKTKEFKSTLELRSNKIKEQQERKAKITGNSTMSPMKQFAASSSAVTQQSRGPLPNPYQAIPYSNPYSADSALDSNHSHGENRALMLLAPPAQTEYFESRELAATEVEKTISELGTIFKRLSTMIQQQGELVDRIDYDIEEAVSNTDKAQGVLMKTYESLSRYLLYSTLLV